MLVKDPEVEALAAQPVAFACDNPYHSPHLLLCDLSSSQLSPWGIFPDPNFQGFFQLHGARWGPCSQQMFMDGLIHLLMNQESDSQASMFPQTPKWYLRKHCMTLTPERAELTRS